MQLKFVIEAPDDRAPCLWVLIAFMPVSDPEFGGARFSAMPQSLQGRQVGMIRALETPVGRSRLRPPRILRRLEGALGFDIAVTFDEWHDLDSPEGRALTLHSLASLIKRASHFTYESVGDSGMYVDAIEKLVTARQFVQRLSAKDEGENHG